MTIRKPRTSVKPGQTEISVVTFAGHEPIRSGVKKMTARQALNLARAHQVETGTEYTVDHVVVEGHCVVGPVVRHLGSVPGVVHAVGAVPAGY